MAEWAVVSYRDARGRIPVDDYLDTLQVKDRARVLRTIGLLEEYGPTLRMPHARHLRGKVWELRVDARPSSYRVLYAAVPGGQFVLLHVFAKRGEKTPGGEMEMAERRLADFLARSGTHD
jgi:phage-related protein